MADAILNLCQLALAPGDRIVAAVSGGADSMCLVHALHRVAARCQAKLFVAHVNHQLRGEEAEEDARFVCSWAREQGLPRFIARVTVRRRGGESEEAVARRERYRALIQACAYFQANKLATAHQANDQVETFLLNLLRGSGSRGLQGIPEERPLAEGITLVRPLLTVTRTEIEAYCQVNQVPWRTDATNRLLSYQRNAIRCGLLPQLRQINPAIDGILLNTIEILRGDQALLGDITGQTLATLTIPSPLPFAPIALSVQGLRRLKPPLRNRVILELLPKDAGMKHVRAVIALAEGKTGASLNLPGGKRVFRFARGIAFGESPPPYSIPETGVGIPGLTELGSLSIHTSFAPFPGAQEFWLPAETESFLVGSRRPGDYFYPPGGGKKLKDFMIDRKIPRWLRNQYLVFRCGQEIFMVAGLVRDQRFLAPGDGKRPVYIKLENKGGTGNEHCHGRQSGGDPVDPTGD